jgi:hypothetical protein
MKFVLLLNSMKTYVTNIRYNCLTLTRMHWCSTERWYCLLLRNFSCKSSTRQRHSSPFSFKYNQQDARFYNTCILYYCRCPICFGRFLRPSSGTQELYTQNLVRTRLAAATASVVGVFQPNNASGSSSKTGTYQLLCVHFLSS